MTYSIELPGNLSKKKKNNPKMLSFQVTRRERKVSVWWEILTGN